MTVTGIVVGMWGDTSEGVLNSNALVEALVAESPYGFAEPPRSDEKA